MPFPLDEQHAIIREMARNWVSTWYDGSAGSDRIYPSDTGHDVAAWTDFAQKHSMARLVIDTAYGGAGLADLGLVVVMEELGASLCAIPFLTTCGIVADIIAAVGTNLSKDKYLRQIAAGDMRATYFDGHDAVAKKVFNVVYADCATELFLSRRAGEGIEIISIPAGTPGLSIKSEKHMDPTRTFSTVDWHQVADNDINFIGTTTEAALNIIVQQSFIGLAAECVGGAQKCLDIIREYTEKYTEGAGSVAHAPTLKHRCADMFALIEAARSAVYSAAIAPPQEKTEAVMQAKAYASDAFFKVASEAIDVQGGLGPKRDYPLHVFLERARANRTMFGP